MALQKRVSELPAVTQVAGTDLLIVSSNNATKRTSVQQIGAYFQANGVAGPQGETGPAGAAGVSASISVGTVTTGAPGSSASVVNAGTSSAALLNFTIPAGATGATGPQGPTGPAGTTAWAGITDKPSTFPPSSHQHVAADISDFTSAVIAAAPPTTNASLLTSGTLPDARLSSNIARTSDVSSAVAALVNSSPAALDTLGELAAALGNDANFSTTVTNALAAKAPLASPTFTGTVSGVTKAMVGLGNVDNTADASKPVSTAQAAADAAVASAAASDATTKANAAQAYAVQRANHTGTQAASTITGLAAVATSGSASDLGTGTLPAARLPSTTVTGGSYGSASSVSTFTVGADGRLTAAGSTSIAISAGSVSGLATVATSGSYTDLSNKPTIPSAYSLPVATSSVLGGVKAGANVAIDGTGVISVAAPVTSLPAGSITGLATVATSGNYNDLSNKPAAYSLPITVALGTGSGDMPTDAAACDILTATANGDTLVQNPTNPVDGKTIRWKLSQDSSGGHTWTLGSKFVIPSSASSPLPWSTAPNKTDLLAATYDAVRDKWDIIAFVPGY